MFLAWKNRIKNLFVKKKPLTLADKYHNYLQTAYPRNHTYHFWNNRGKISVKPKRKLAKRYQKIYPLISKDLTSFADIGCSKGFFNFSINTFPNCERNIGIDIHQEDIDVCCWVKEKMKDTRIIFKKMQLHQLAEKIDELGGPFDTVLLLNTYQYLYFGSEGHKERYLDHDFIFKNLKTICGKQLIFNNRITLTDCQQQVKDIVVPVRYQKNYSAEKILTTAEKYFTVKKMGNIGRYPLFLMNKI